MEHHRPSTTVLRKPCLLNTKLLGVLDMSRLSREHLVAIAELANFSTADRLSRKYFSSSNVTVSSSGDVGQSKNCRQHLLNDETPGYLCHTVARLTAISNSVPVPCVTCKRTNLPERFHSHPNNQVMADVKFEKGSIGSNNDTRKSIGDITTNGDARSHKLATNAAVFVEINDMKDGSQNISTKNCCYGNFENQSICSKDVALHRPQILCEICGKNFGSSTIEVHKEQCAWDSSDRKTNSSTRSENHLIGNDQRVQIESCTRGKEYDPASTTAYENQCLRRIKMQNSNEHHRFEHEGISEDANLFWILHKSQLVPCNKCGRKFYPNRLDVHFGICKGTLGECKKQK